MYTSHGHQIKGTPVEHEPSKFVARCGGPGLCSKCSKEAAVLYQSIDEIDRNARAYGYEVGRAGKLLPLVINVSPDNPFLDKNWREHIKE